MKKLLAANIKINSTSKSYYSLTSSIFHQLSKTKVNLIFSSVRCASAAFTSSKNASAATADANTPAFTKNSYRLLLRKKFSS